MLLKSLNEIPSKQGVVIFGDDELTSEAVRFLSKNRPDLSIEQKSGKALIQQLSKIDKSNYAKEDIEIGNCFVILCTGEIDELESVVKEASIPYKIFEYGVFDQRINWFQLFFKTVPIFIATCLLWFFELLLIMPLLIFASFLPHTKIIKDRHTKTNFDKSKVLLSKIAIKKGKYNRLFGIVSKKLMAFDQLTYISRVVYGCPNKLDEISAFYGVPLLKFPHNRWGLYQDILEKMTSSLSSVKPKALDIGAGCLKESYELSKWGFEVDSVQLEPQVIESYMEYYDWGNESKRPRVITKPIDKMVIPYKYDLITAFNVLEHILPLESHLNTIHKLLKDEGYLLVSVPNKKSLCESIWYRQHLKLLKSNSIDKTGKSHVHFFTPKEWIRLFERHGFSVKTHNMGVGFIGYDLIFTIYNIISQKYFEYPVRRLTSFFNIKYIPNSFERIFYPEWLLYLAHRLDLLLKPIFRERWGTNLMILKKQRL